LLAFDNNGPRYRYRRILFPLLAGGFGQLGGPATVVGMVVWLSIAMGLATSAIADLCFQLRRRGATVLAAILNPGVLASLLLLVGEALGMALSLVGTALLLRSRTGLAVAALALATLTKETYLLVAVSLGAWLWRRRRRGHAVLLFGVPAATLVIWSTWVALTIPHAPGGIWNVGLPFVGLAQAIPFWMRSERNVLELLFIGCAVIMFAVAAWMAIAGRNQLLRCLAAPWLGLACVATLAVWGKPNNICRAFAILWPLTVLFVNVSMQGHLARTAEPAAQPMPQAAEPSESHESGRDAGLRQTQSDP
jgi:hypothetical protein